MSLIKSVLAANEQWSADVEDAEPGFFAELAKGQAPPVRQPRTHGGESNLTNVVAYRSFG